MREIGHLLDPISGYGPDDDARESRINLRRVQLGSVIMAVDGLMEAGLNISRKNVVMWPLSAIIVAGGLIFLGVARRAQQSAGAYRAKQRLVDIFVVFALLCASVAGYAVAPAGRIPGGYAMLYLAISAFFLVPPRRFMWMGIGTYALFVGWVSSLNALLYDKLAAILYTGLAIICGSFGRWSIARVQEVGRLQRRQIAEQNTALQEANAKLERRNVEQNELMAIAAHDLRSPLFGLRSVLDLAASRPPGSPDALKRLLDAANTSLTEMLGLVGRLLDAHEVEGLASPILRRRDIVHYAADAIRRAEAHATANKVSLVLVAPRPIQAMIHGEGVEQILDNLISNAVRFSPSGTVIRVIVDEDSAGAFLEVADKGVGIPDFEQSKLFSKFARGANRPIHGAKGSGLGLYIVQTLAHAMNARCVYRPNGEGGSVFSIRFSRFSDEAEFRETLDQLPSPF